MLRVPTSVALLFSSRYSQKRTVGRGEGGKLRWGQRKKKEEEKTHTWNEYFVGKKMPFCLLDVFCTHKTQVFMSLLLAY